MFKKFAAAAAATALVFSTTAVAGPASKLSLSNARATTAAKKSNEIVASPLLIIAGIIGVVAVLEVTGAIDIFSDSP